MMMAASKKDILLEQAWFPGSIVIPRQGFWIQRNLHNLFQSNQHSTLPNFVPQIPLKRHCSTWFCRSSRFLWCFFSPDFRILHISLEKANSQPILTSSNLLQGLKGVGSEMSSRNLRFFETFCLETLLIGNDPTKSTKMARESESLSLWWVNKALIAISTALFHLTLLSWNFNLDLCEGTSYEKRRWKISGLYLYVFLRFGVTANTGLHLAPSFSYHTWSLSGWSN